MAEFPKYFKRGDLEKVAHNVRDEVRLKFAGYKPVAKPEADTEPPAPTVTADSAVPQLPLEELVKHPEAQGAEVVDKTEDKPKSTNPRAQR